MNPCRITAGLMLAVLCMSGCESAPQEPTTAPAPPLTVSTPAATATAPATVHPSPATPTPGPTPRFRTPTPPPHTGTLVTTEGAFQVIAQPTFFWTLKLPGDWLITYDRGFELFANNPQRTAFMRIFSDVWATPQERLPTARAYVDYWKHYRYGNLFPPYAAGTQVAETEISQDKPGGPYLRYEFDDRIKGLNYLQVYASGGGANSLVLTTWAPSADFETLRSTLDGIVASVALVPGP